MIPSDPKEIEKLKALAERNIANGGWGDEVNIPGVPGETSVPLSPGEDQGKAAVTQTLSKTGSKRLPRKK